VLKYPVTTTKVLAPEQALRNLLARNASELESSLFLDNLPQGINDLSKFFEWIGLPRYQKGMKKPSGVKDDFHVGAAVIPAKIGNAISVSCAACHSANLFGRTIIGLPNKGVRANELFVLVKKIAPALSPKAFQALTKANDEETEIYAQTREALQSVAADKPMVLGLDTSLAHVGRSLAKRKLDEWATVTPFNSLNPRKHTLDHQRADSKPAVWWNVRYKTRFLSDGSVVSGHPITTNILWNEIGRGANLRELDHWLNQNHDVLEDTLAYLNAIEAPDWESFFGSNSLDIKRAKKGEEIFIENCSKCHGNYTKEWQTSHKTVSVDYPTPTKVKNVGTDPMRYLGMIELGDQLNDLEISKRHNLRIQAQEGYVPPPLVGIWARYPYFHNNSIPNLCALVEPRTRPKIFYIGPANDIEKEFSKDCVGYPTGSETPKAWLDRAELRYVTSKEGLSNQGHTKMFLKEDGSYKFTQEEKWALIEFLKTL